MFSFLTVRVCSYDENAFLENVFFRKISEFLLIFLCLVRKLKILSLKCGHSYFEKCFSFNFRVEMFPF